MISGPFVKSTGGSGWYDEQLSYRWLGPRRTRPRMPYRRRRGFRSPQPWGAIFSDNFHYKGTLNLHNGAYVKCYDKFWNTAYKSASLGITIYESRQTLKMMKQRMSQFAQFLRALRRRDAIGVIESLSIRKVEQKRHVVHVTTAPFTRLADNFLELSFGWMPVVNDIVDCFEVLNQDFKGEPHRKRVVAGPWYHRDTGDGVLINGATWLHYSIKGTTRIVNHNLALATQLGLTNIALVAWDAVPFSFIVDKFVGISKYLRSWSNDWGLEVTNVTRQYMSWSTGTSSVWLEPGQKPFRYHWIERVAGDPPMPAIWDRLQLPTVSSKEAFLASAIVVQQLRGLQEIEPIKARLKT